MVEIYSHSKQYHDNGITREKNPDQLFWLECPSENQLSDVIKMQTQMMVPIAVQ